MIFIVEDDEDISQLVEYALSSKDFNTLRFENAGAFFKHLNGGEHRPDLILLDIMLPECDGLQILKKLKDHILHREYPVIMLTAKSSEIDKVKGLDLGADDYITKPFGVMELISRINAVLRRTKKTDSLPVLGYKNIQIDDSRHEVLIDGDKISLTYKEYELLHYLILNKEIVLSRSKILENVWGYDFDGESRTVDMHIKTLRQKMGLSGGHIKTIRNVGYKIGD